MRLEGKTAVVTGAGSGIGKAMATALHAEGASVVLADVSGAQEEVASGLGDRATAVQADVSQEADVENVIATAVREFGGLDVLCNNAGIDGELGPFGQVSLDNFDRVIAINLRGVYLGMHFGIPAMLESGGGGSIISTSSIAGLTAQPGGGAYCAAKAGVIGLTRVAAVEHAAEGIRANAICPGIIDTPMVEGLKGSPVIETAMAMTPMGRIGKPSEIAEVTVFLASDQSSFVTGQAIPVDGGFTTV